MRTSLRLASLLALTSLTLSLSGCGGDSVEDGYSNLDKEGTCKEFCEQANDCGGESVEDCTKECADNDLVSKAGQKVITECSLEAGCSEDDPLAFADCVQGGVKRLPVSPAAEKFCEDGLPSLSECSGQSASGTVGLCKDGVALVADEVITDFQDCADLTDCDAQTTCLGFALISAIGIGNLEALASGEGDLGGLGGLADLIGLGDLSGGFEGGFGGQGEGDGGEPTSSEASPRPTPAPRPQPGMGGASG